MNITRLLFILSLLIICTLEDPDTCPNTYENNLKNVCQNINKNKPCSYFNLNQKCYPKGCENAEDEQSCGDYLPGDNYDIHTQKCEWNSDANGGKGKCEVKYKKCNDYNIFGLIRDEKGGDSCTGLSNTEQNCILTSKTACTQKERRCEDIRITSTSDSACSIYSIITSDLKAKCIPQTALDGTISCALKSNDPKTCYDFQSNNIYVGDDKNICKDLIPTNNEYSCIYFNGYCRQVYTNCVSYTSENDCKGKTPVTDGDYNYRMKCFWDDTKDNNNCIQVPRKCDEFIAEYADEEKCGMLELKDLNKKCVFNGDSCIEEYTTCKNYSDYSIDKDRIKCEDSLSYLSPGEKCEYHFGQDECIPLTKKYSTCKEYNDEKGEKDRIVCESIRLETSPFYCVFDKDNQCVERELLCSEAFNRDDCLHIAKASDPNKKCAFGSKCYEEYIRCEDYIENNDDNCTNIRLYNGLQCEYDYDSKRCKTRNKLCSEARTEEECKLISKTGVSDPERKVCDHVSGSCQEIFKYCSDYKGPDPNVCKKIKPYDFDGEKLDKLYKCKLEGNPINKCQKVPKDCEDGNDNPMLCNEISPNIKNNLIKYCRYAKYESSTNKNKCIEDYKTCESYKETSDESDADDTIDHDKYEDYSEKKSNCEKIIPQGYETGLCTYQLDNGKYKCVANDICTNLLETQDKYQEICYQGNSTCAFDSTYKCYEKEMSCEEIRFYTESEDNEKICQRIEASKPYKICVLKEDKSGCEEIYRELSFSTAYSSYSEPPGTKSEESSTIIKGNNMITILLFLLF